MEGTIRIGELARRTGVSPELLRAWELRYGLLQPSRSPGGFRLYSDVDEARIRHMTRLIGTGMSAAEAARLATGNGAGAMPAPEAPVVDELARQLRRALDDLDGPSAHTAIDRLLAAVSLDVFLTDVLLPYLRDLGDRWASGRASVAQEHFASHLIRGRLLALGRDWDRGGGPGLLLACLPGEAHDLGLIIFGLLAARRGWRITFLGADTPLDTVVATARTIRPALTILAATTPTLVRSQAKGIRSVVAVTPTAIAGLGDSRDVAATGATPLPLDIVEAVDALAP